ncbi:MAG TPA: GAF domain-containing protein [Candidatus Acidoferrales bacterium]|nr:GAF domain-containing protein [Candidatus Acidoferrales bacterium]
MNNEQAVLDEIGSTMNEGAAPKETAKRIAQTLRLSAGYGSVTIYAVTEKEIIALGWTGSEEPAHLRFAVTKGLTGAVVKERAPLVVGNVSKDPRYLVAYTKMRSEMIVPVLGPGASVIGTINIASERENAFGEKDVRFVEECAKKIMKLFSVPGIT